MSELQYEITECAAFFLVSHAGAEKSPTPNKEAISHMARTAEMSFDIATQIGGAIGMTPDAIKARMKLMTQSMLDEMSNDYVNYSILLDKYAMPCRNRLNTVDAKLDEIAQRVGGE